MSSYFNHFTEKLKTNHLTLLSSVKTVVEPRANSFVTIAEPYDPIKSTLYSKLYLNEENKKLDIYPAANAEPLFGYGIVLSKANDNKVIVNAIAASNPIYRDVLISVFNESFLLPFSLVVHGPHGPVQDTFYFVKKETERAIDDKASLKRFGSELNTTLHEKDDDQGRKVGLIILIIKKYTYILKITICLDRWHSDTSNRHRTECTLRYDGGTREAKAFASRESKRYATSLALRARIDQEWSSDDEGLDTAGNGRTAEIRIRIRIRWRVRDRCTAIPRTFRRSLQYSFC